MGDNPLQAVISHFPLEGGNRITDAPEVVFNFTLGYKSMETSLSPPVESGLHSFRRDWKTNKFLNNALNIIANGYIPLIHSRYKAHRTDLALASCIQSLLSKNTIERVENVKFLEFDSRLFLVSKPQQRWRPVIDLSRLNTFLHVEKFKMETPESIRIFLIPGQ